MLVDCGPATTVDTLFEALGDRVPRAVLVTHIHFDHAGAAGALVERWPDLEVYVHSRGARHLGSPERLEASARRVFGDAAFDEQFGGLTPIPEANLRPLEGGETVFGYDVIYTPGHASHHVAYVDPATGVAFVGDVAGARIVDGGPVVPPMPPPDIDVDAWLDSIRQLVERQPSWIGLPHFGAVEHPMEHLDAADTAVRKYADLATSLELQDFEAAMLEDLADLDEETRESYLLMAVPEHAHAGVRRWAERSA